MGIKKKSKLALFSFMGVFGLLCITAAVTYAFFSYTKAGTDDNTITTGTIKFLYNEESGQGRGITITNALPVASNETAKTMADRFDFRITSNNSSAIKYYITARESKDSDEIMEGAVNVYLTDQNDGNQTVFRNVTRFNDSSLVQYSGVNAADFTEKVLYSYTIPAGTTNYNQGFSLRMWVDAGINYSESTREVTPANCSVTLGENVELTKENCEAVSGTFTPAVTENYYPYNDKTFKITVNVYSSNVSGNEPAYDSQEIGYTRSGRPNVASIKDALDDLNTLIP